MASSGHSSGHGLRAPESPLLVSSGTVVTLRSSPFHRSVRPCLFGMSGAPVIVPSDSGSLFALARVRVRVRADDLPPESEVNMAARTSTWAGSPEALDKWAEHVNAQVR